MRALPFAKANRSNSPQRGQPSSRSLPIQAKTKDRQVSQEPVSPLGPAFGDIPVFPESRRNDDAAHLPQSLRTKMEAAFSADFSDVRVHSNAVNAESLSALAFTQGRDIHFASGQYNPGSVEGQKIIAHELAHIVQQRSGRVETPAGRAVPVNDDPALEAEADVLGANAVYTGRAEAPKADSRSPQPSASNAQEPVQMMQGNVPPLKSMALRAMTDDELENPPGIAQGHPLREELGIPGEQQRRQLGAFAGAAQNIDQLAGQLGPLPQDAMEGVDEDEWNE